MIDDNRAVDAAHTDFSKTFDKVPHGRLTQKVKSHEIHSEQQGSVLGPLLFADDTKIGGAVGSEEGCQKILQDIDRLETWAEKWHMEFNPDNCE
eukprot:g28476.t1